MASYSKITSHYCFYFMMLAIMSCDFYEESYSCYDRCENIEIISSEFSSVDLIPYYNQGDTYFFGFEDSVCTCDFGIAVGLNLFENVVQEPSPGCCAYEHLWPDSIETVELFMINVINEDTVNIASDFQLTSPVDDGTNLQEFSDGDLDKEYQSFHMKLTKHNGLPKSTKFYVEVNLNNGKKLIDTSHIVLFEGQ
ncbi:MAG: hypothetical protein ABJF04_01365 [Reichenbachiella sp.]|uniref:hypothetical protein n=1 Tax=Reichenbachiella sp. TaxID=2184521 RepID=UPI003267D451